MNDSRYTVVDYLSLSPSQCTIYPKFFRNNPQEFSKREGNRLMQLLENGPESKNKTSVMPASNKHNFQLSKSAAKNLQSKVEWLYHFAKKKTIVTRKGKVLTDLKLNFATLKLPSEQVDSSDFITKNCLNQLFIEISKKYDFRNYVWRLEYQKNGNLHYHFVTDVYIDWHFLNRTWSRILNKYGYVDQYTRKFSEMSLSDYIKSQGGTDKTPFATHQERYAKGCQNKWKEPNCVDVKAVFGKNNIGQYISKYMAKNESGPGELNLPTCEVNSNNSRLWFCSRSLSKCEKIRDIREAMELDFFGILVQSEGTKRVVHDYCTIIYFKFHQLGAIAKKAFSVLFDDYKQELDYCPA